MKNFRDLLKEELKDPEFKKEWDALEPEFRHIKQQLETVGKITLNEAETRRAWTRAAAVRCKDCTVAG